MARATVQADIEALDRLEQKVRTLVGTIGSLQAEQARLSEENRRLEGELDSLRGRLQDAESASGELAALRQERDEVRSRVAGMLEALEGLDL
ncbi:MAG TPA: cell division protein ZapB [Vicinamibacterales bacterium]|nr:cell division protein ZapB [Gemmatimonadales bacterium]HOC17847.1 cell division protein ZapB [Vicinamibacterales bacterium]